MTSTSARKLSHYQRDLLVAAVTSTGLLAGVVLAPAPTLAILVERGLVTVSPTSGWAFITATGREAIGYYTAPLFTIEQAEQMPLFV